MHEYGLVRTLLERVDAEARTHASAAVHRITVRRSSCSNDAARGDVAVDRGARSESEEHADRSAVVAMSARDLRRRRGSSRSVAGADHALLQGRRYAMKRFPALAILAVVVAWSSAPVLAACRLYGSQLRCDTEGRRVVIGTQVNEAPGEATSLPLHALQGGPAFADPRSPSRPLVDIHLQDFSGDPSMCKRYGDETYCY
jgi:hypothetical protein